MKKTPIILLLCLTFTQPAAAYIGPGLGIALASYVTWPIALLAGLASIVVYYPLRWIWHKVYNRLSGRRD